MDSEKQTRYPKMEDAGRRVDEEIEEFIRWFNNDVVPSIRHHSSRALRTASSKLSELADLMDKAPSKDNS